MLKRHKIKPGTLVTLTPVIEPFDPVVGLVLGPDMKESQHTPCYFVLADGERYSLPESLLAEIITEPEQAENFAQ
jgi:hypothetical protein